MKPHVYLLAGALALAIPASAQSTPTPIPQFQAAQKIWSDALDELHDLDGLIAARKLAGVHDAALNLRDTVRELRFGWSPLSEDQKTRVDDAIRKIDGLLDDLHESADNNNPAGVARDQRKLHLLLDQIASGFPYGTLKPAGPVTAASAVRDPYCRMAVDPATAAAHVIVDGQTYYFCSVKEAQAFQKNPGPYVALYDELAFGKPKTYTFSTSVSAPVAAGHPTQIAFAVHEQGFRQPVTNFQLVHEKLMHLIVVSDDLSWFAHEHPGFGKGGRFYLQPTFPREGRYILFADFTPADGTNQIIRTEVKVGNGLNRDPRPLQPDQTLSRVVDGIQVDLKTSAPLQAGRQVLLTYTLTRGAQPVKDMTLYLGAMGHLMAISQNGQKAVHTHTVSPGTDPETNLTVLPSMSTATGPTQTFKLQLPTSGLYKIWAQFGVNGKTITIPFTFNVQENPTMKLNKTNLTKSAAIAAALGSALPAGAKTPAPQRITVTLPADYKSAAATVQAGKPVAITFFLKEEAGCGDTVVVPAANWTKSLQVGQKATLTFTPKKSGPLSFQCGMGMYKGSITVK